MTLAIMAVFIVGISVLVVWADRHDRWRRDQGLRSWQAAARHLGLGIGVRTDWRGIAGVLNGVPVRADFECRRQRSAGNTQVVEEATIFRAGGDGRIPLSLVLRQGAPLRSLGRLMGASAPGSGDAAFDDQIEIGSIDAFVCASLSSGARRQVASLLDIGGEVSQGTVMHRVGGGEFFQPDYLVQMLQAFAQLAASLAVTAETLQQRLASNAVHDPVAGVRLQNLRFLLDPQTNTEPALLATAARALLDDAHAPIRLLAARALGPEGVPALLALATGSSVETALRVDALHALDVAGIAERNALLPELLAAGPPELTCAALYVVAGRRLCDFADSVLACTTSEHLTVRAQAASTLAVLGPSGVEATLLALLRDGSADVQRASAEALGHVGGVAAVEPLLPLARALVPTPLRHAARDAIARIQSRLGPAEAGWLSLAPHDELSGAVALADESPAGALSLTESEEAARPGLTGR